MPENNDTSKAQTLFTDSVEVMDANARPFAVMSLPEVKHQSLYHRCVHILAYDEAGKLLLRKRTKDETPFPERWDLALYTHVRTKESVEETALRLLTSAPGLRWGRLRRVRELPADHWTGFAFVSLFSVECRAPEPSGPLEAEPFSGMFVDQDELAFLRKDFMELLTPSLIRCLEENLLFPHSL